MILHVFKHEMRLVFREPRFWIPFVIPPVLLAVSQAIAVSRYGVAVMQGMEGYMMLLLGCLMAPMGAPLAADSFAGERERNSLELLQLSPIKPSQLFWGKLLAVLPFPLGFTLICQLLYFATHYENLPATVAVAALLGATSVCLLVNAFSLLLSLRAKTVRAATQGTLFLIIPLFLGVQFFYEDFLKGLALPLLTLVLSVVLCCVAAALSLRKFTKL